MSRRNEESTAVKECREKIFASQRAMEAEVAKCVRCPRCGGKVRYKEFGIGKRGVWVGCDRTAECQRFVEVHREGWSVAECCQDWNRKNSGIIGCVRKAKWWWKDRYGKYARIRRKYERGKAAAREKLAAERTAVLGGKDLRIGKEKKGK